MKPAMRVALMAGAVAVAFVAGLMSSGCDRSLSPIDKLAGGPAVAGQPVPGSGALDLMSAVLMVRPRISIGAGNNQSGAGNN